LRGKGKGARILKRGDIVKLSFSPQKGREQAGFRPAIVLSPKIYNEASNIVLLCAITNAETDWPYAVAFPKGSVVTGCALADQIRSMDVKDRRFKYVGRAPKEVLEKVLALVETLLGRDI
jgi:mRNA interferase MazF